jgi:DnaD/phage-associated family protein
MEYQILPIGSIWQNGTFCVPVKIVSNYIKLASEYQLKALMLILSSNGKATSGEIAKALGCTENDADNFLDFWVEEGVLSKDGTVVAQTQSEPQQTVEVEETVQTAPNQVETVSVKKVESMPVPTLSPKDIVSMCRESKELTELMRNAQEVLGKTLSHAEQQLIINMVTYYGLPEEIALTILHYYKSEREKGKAIGTAYIAAMAKNWSEEGITTLEAADEKLKDLEATDKLWADIIGLAGVSHKKPTAKQREMVKAWADNFSMEMIALACDAMRENTDKPTLNYVNSVLKNWKKKGIKTPADVKADNEKHSKKSTSNKYEIDTTYDIDEIAKKAMFKENYDL